MITTALVVCLLMQAPPNGSASSVAATRSGSRQVGDTNVTYLFGSVLPKDATWRPLTNDQRLQLYIKNTWANPGIAFRTLMPAAIGQLNNEPKEWGQGMAGYARRAGSTFGTFTISDTLQATTAAAIGYDVRYLRCQCEGGWARLLHAWKQVFITKNREGRWRPNYPNLLSGPAASAIAVYGWYPPSVQNANEVWRSSLTQIAFPLGFLPLVEFGPEIKKLFRRR